MYNDFISLLSSFPQGYPLSHGWLTISSIPFAPNLYYGFLNINYSIIIRITLFIKSIDLELNPLDVSLICTCFAKICSRISYLFLPLYGLLPKSNSYAITPSA